MRINYIKQQLLEKVISMLLLAMHSYFTPPNVLENYASNYIFFNTYSHMGNLSRYLVNASPSRLWRFVKHSRNNYGICATSLATIAVLKTKNLPNGYISMSA